MEGYQLGITIYTKENCHRCEALKTFLNKHNIPYKEKSVLNQEVISELHASEYVVKNFCDEKKCVIITPIVNLDGTWMHREFFDVNGFSEIRAMKIFNVA